jgi:hypothetical protein
VLRFLRWAISAALRPKALLVAENAGCGSYWCCSAGPAAAPAQCEPAVLDSRQSIVRLLAQFNTL